MSSTEGRDAIGQLYKSAETNVNIAHHGNVSVISVSLVPFGSLGSMVLLGVAVRQQGGHTAGIPT